MVVNYLCLVIGFTLLAVGTGLRARHIRSKEEYNYLRWVVFDTLASMFAGLAMVTFGLGVLVLAANWLPF